MSATGNVWFTADQHFNHAKVIEYADRPFNSVEGMNEELVKRHNSLVKPGDRVYHLGDFAWHDHNNFVKRLNGQHYLIKGNHDHVKRLKEPLGFIWVKDVAQIKINGNLFFLSHFAHRVWPQSHYGAFHLYGHSHGMIEEMGRSTDVGVDANDYYPVALDSVLEKLGGKGFSYHHPGPEAPIR
jgi:calcineurin-like phosphoesterase family protein